MSLSIAPLLVFWICWIVLKPFSVIGCLLTLMLSFLYQFIHCFKIVKGMTSQPPFGDMVLIPPLLFNVGDGR